MIAQLGSLRSRTFACLMSMVVLAGCASTPESPVAGGSAAVQQTVEPREGELAAHYALQQVGVPYRYGGDSPSGFDCSGLVQFSWLRAGKSVPRTTAALWNYAVPVRRSDMQAGDLVFFSIEGKMQHVGIYLGDDRFVHAPQSGRKVSVASLKSGFYDQAFLRAGRPH